jgi:hypothetical protein
MAASEDKSHALVASLLQSYDALMQAAREELHLPDKSSSWIPATMLSPSCIGITRQLSTKHGYKDDEWVLLSRAEEYNTIIGNTSLTEGVHFWEVHTDELRHRIALGVVFPNDDTQLNVANLSACLGDNRSDLLFNNAVEVHLFIKDNFLIITERSLKTEYSIFAAHVANFPKGFTIGVLLDLIKTELKVYVLNQGGFQSNSELFVASLMKGRKYYPAFSLNGKINLKLDLNPVIPFTISAYKERMDNMMDLLRKFRTKVDNAEKLGQTATAEYHQWRERYQNLSKLLNTLLI